MFTNYIEASTILLTYLATEHIPARFIDEIDDWLIGKKSEFD